MTTVLCSLFFLGFYILYSTSKKADLNLSSKIQAGLHRKPILSTSLGCLFLLIAFLILILIKGLAAGMLTGILLLMIAGGLIVILSPLKFITTPIIPVIFFFSLLLETVIN